MKPPIVITGIGRSGTTLLQSMLDAHPKLAFPPETHFLKRYVVPELSGRSRKKEREDLIGLLKEDPGLRRLGWDLQKWLQKEFSEGSARMQRLYGKMLERWVKERGADRAGDKDPMIVEYIPHLKQCFPEAYLVHIIRDPRDVALSRIRSDWGKGRPLLAHLCEHRTLFDKVRKEGPECFGERYIELHYEELLQDPEGTLRKLCEKLPIDYDPSMLEYEKAAKDLVQEDEGAWKQNVLGPLLEKNLGKWKREMAPAQLRTVETVLARTIRKAGYEESGARSGWKAFWLALPLLFCNWAYRLKFHRQRVREHG